MAAEPRSSPSINGASAAPNLKSLVFRQKDTVGYFDGEPDGE